MKCELCDPPEDCANPTNPWVECPACRTAGRFEIGVIAKGKKKGSPIYESCKRCGGNEERNGLGYVTFRSLDP